MISSFQSRLQKFFITVLMLAVMVAPHAYAFKAFAADDDAPPKPIKEKQLLNHLEQITAWQRSILSIETAPNNALEKLLKETLQRSSGKVLQYGFEFARAEAAALTTQQAEQVTVENPNDARNQLLKTKAEIAQRITDIQKEQSTLNNTIARTPKRRQEPLLIQRERLAGELKIANVRNDLLNSAMDLFTDKDTSDSQDVLSKINNMSLTIPGAAKKKTTSKTTTTATGATPLTAVLPVPSPTPTAADVPPDEPAPSKGLIGTGSDILNLYRKKQEMAALAQETKTLHDDNKDLVENLRETLKYNVKYGNDLTSSLSSIDPDTVDAQRAKIDALITNYKQISVAIVPLAQVNVWLEASERDLQEWRSSLDEQLANLTRTILIQLGLLVLAVLIPLMISEAARRTIRYYIHDTKRQRQFNIARRIVFGFLIFLILLLNFVTEFSSIATFAGFLTAGLAVALQNVILSSVAHFFYFGRFGVRVGDRVTIKGVTGEVVQVGIIRLYIMELGGPAEERYATGRIVAFPNSILFQNEPFAKHITGADYSWQEITFMLDPTSDYQLADKKLNDAVNAVYAQYHDVMEKQKMAMTRTTHLTVNMPLPKGFLNVTADGLAFVIRYPIQSDHVTEINQRITKKILETIEKEPALRLVNSNPPKIESVEDDTPVPTASSSSDD